MENKWTRGCGIGCIVLALVSVALVGSGLWYARQMKAEFKVVRASEEALIAAHGSLDDWRPAALVPDPEHVARFVDIRNGLDEWRLRLATHTRYLAGIEAEETHRIKRFMRSIRAGGELATLYAGFWRARNEALIEAGMGAGEYVWLYHLAYYAWLGHDPAAGSDQDAWYGGDAERGAAGFGEDKPRERMRQLVLPMLEGVPAPDDCTRAWRDAELARLAADPARYPWQTDLPGAVATVFESRRPELEAAWEPLVNPVELLFELEK